MDSPRNLLRTTASIGIRGWNSQLHWRRCSMANRTNTLATAPHIQTWKTRRLHLIHKTYQHRQHLVQDMGLTPDPIPPAMDPNSYAPAATRLPQKERHTHGSHPYTGSSRSQPGGPPGGKNFLRRSHRSLQSIRQNGLEIQHRGFVPHGHAPKNHRPFKKCLAQSKAVDGDSQPHWKKPLLYKQPSSRRPRLSVRPHGPTIRSFSEDTRGVSSTEFMGISTTHFTWTIEPGFVKNQAPSLQ